MILAKMEVAQVEMEWYLGLADLLDQLFYGLAWGEAPRMRQWRLLVVMSSKTGRNNGLGRPKLTLYHTTYGAVGTED